MGTNAAKLAETRTTTISHIQVRNCEQVRLKNDRQTALCLIHFQPQHAGTVMDWLQHLGFIQILHSGRTLTEIISKMLPISILNLP